MIIDERKFKNVGGGCNVSYNHVCNTRKRKAQTDRDACINTYTAYNACIHFCVDNINV